MGDAQALISMIDGDWLAKTILVLVGVMTLIKLVDAVMEIVKKWRKPQQDEDAQTAEKRRSCDQKFARDLSRIEAMESEQVTNQKTMRLLAVGVMELLGHYLHNGNTERMQEAEDKLKDHIYGKM